MNITVVGNADHDLWFAHRLRTQGFTVNRQERDRPSMTPVIDDSSFSGLIVGHTLIDTGTSEIKARYHLARRCYAAGWHYAEMAGPWQAFGQTFGFALFIGAEPSTCEMLSPLFDALAPQSNAWLRCGPAAAGRFAAQIFSALSMTGGLAYQAGWPTPGQTPQTPDWGAFLLQQHVLADQLSVLCKLYLSLHPPSAETMPTPHQLLATFKQASHQQTDFSANLAQLIIVALTQHEAQQALFSQLMASYKRE